MISGLKGKKKKIKIKITFKEGREILCMVDTNATYCVCTEYIQIGCSQKRNTIHPYLHKSQSQA